MSLLNYNGIFLFTWFVLSRDVEVSSERASQNLAICTSEFRVCDVVVRCLFEWPGDCYASIEACCFSGQAFTGRSSGEVVIVVIHGRS